MTSKISILGFRGFGDEQSLDISIPNGNIGSGLTVVVGPNNAGKSSIIEAIKAVSSRHYQSPSFTEGKRNKEAGDFVKVTLYDSNSNKLILKTVGEGGSESEFIEEGFKRNSVNVFVIPSRRTFSPFFSKDLWTREQFLQNDPIQSQRGSTYDNFFRRLFQILKNQEPFNAILRKILSPLPEWTIDQSDSGSHYIKFNFGGNHHNSDGAGEGLLSIFTIVDALYDSKSGDIIVIDEPELSLHPSLQRKLAKVLLEYSSDRQIIISTHSPFFISWTALINGGSMARVIKEKSRTKIYQLPTDISDVIIGLTSNLNNPHILGLDAKEIFFLDDNINIVEGQEDVIFLRKIIKHLQIPILGSFFGWGIGGATNLENILKLLSHLGFQKVACLLDNNMTELSKEISAKYTNYHFSILPTDDIRDKKAIKAKEPIIGLVSSSGSDFKEQYREPVSDILNQINNYHKG